MADVGARPETRLLVRVALVLFLLAILATAWEALALQTPDSPLHFGILAGPIAQLREQSFALGVGACLAALLWPFAHGPRRGWLSLGMLLAGIAISTLAVGYAASQGIVGAQAFDPRPDARQVLYARGAGLSLLALAVIDLFIRTFRAPPVRADRSP